MNEIIEIAKTWGMLYFEWSMFFYNVGTIYTKHSM